MNDHHMGSSETSVILGFGDLVSVGVRADSVLRIYSEQKFIQTVGYRVRMVAQLPKPNTAPRAQPG
jgi:hypothetical protein